LRPLTSGATIGVRFADNYRFVLQLRIGSYNGEPVINCAQLIGDAHLHVTIDNLRRAFGMKRDKVERRADFPGGVVRAAQAMFEKTAHPFSASASRVRAADTRGRQRAANASD